MLGKRFRKGFISDKLKWKKPFSKVKFIGKKNFLIYSNIYNTIYRDLVFLKKKTRKFYLKKLLRKKLLKNYRLINELNIINFNKKTPFKFIFKFFTSCFIISKEYGKITDFHLNTILLVIKKIISKRSLIFIRLKPYKIMFKRSAQVRMGGGKIAKISKVYYPVYPGCVILQIFGLTYKDSRICLNKLKYKLPCSIMLKFVNNI